jgi:hypothetical protein
MITNLYANKVYRENPSALWTLDENMPTSGTLSALPASVNLDGLYGVGAEVYGFSDDFGYYVSTSSSPSDLLVFNDAVPIVYGAENSTSIYSGDGTPALIIPGKGFMHDFGKNKNITVEFWTKIVSNENTVERKIFGPINSTDGLYVNGPFLTIKVANAVGSHYVGQWGRPMLIDISYTNEKISLIVNGAPVLLLDFDINYATFNTEPEDNWLAFFAYDSIPVVSLDCVCIYPYGVSNKQAKLHFIYGQAVEEPESKSTEVSDLSILIDYQMSKTAGNHNYPDHSVWSDGYLRNLSINNRQLSTISMEKPEISFSTEDVFASDWLYTNKINNELVNRSTKFLRMKPRKYVSEGPFGYFFTDEYWTENSNFFFEGLRVGSKRAEGFYLVGVADRYIASQSEVIVDILDELNNRFSIVINYPSAGGETATVQYVYNGSAILYSFIVTATQDFSVGLNIQDFIESVDNDEVEQFFSNAEDLSVFFGGASDYSSTFSGSIYAFGFLTSLDINLIDTYVSGGSNAGPVSGGQGAPAGWSSDGIGVFSNGVLEKNIVQLKTTVCGVTVKPTMTFDVYDIDVSSNGYWVDIIPLKILSKEVSDQYSVDYLQLNIDFPEFSNTSNSIVRSYISFLNIDDTDTMYSNMYDVSVPANGIISTTNWATQRYEFVNENIVRIPPIGSVDSDLSIKVEIEITAKDIFRNPIKIRRLEIASHAFDGEQEIGTKSGKDIFGVGASCFLKLDKSSTPYMYFSKSSGIKLLDSTDMFDGSSFIRIPINETNSDSYYLSVFQFAFKSDFAFTNATNYDIIKMVLPLENYDIYATGQSNGTANLAIEGITDTLSSLDTFSIPGNTVTILVNGKSTTNVRPFEWNIVTIGFLSPLNFGNIDPSIEVGLRLVNNFSYEGISVYQIPEQKLAAQVIYDQWNEYDDETDWDGGNEDGDGLDTSWYDVAVDQVIAGGNIALNPTNIYLDYIGALRISNDLDIKVLSFPGTKWTSYTGYNEVRSTKIPL